MGAPSDRLPAVNDERRAKGKAGAFRAEPQHRSRDFFGPAKAADRFLCDRGLQAFGRAACEAVDHRGMDDAGADGVHADILVGIVTRLVWEKLRPILSDYPDITLELNIDSGFRNIVGEGFDAGIRLGESIENDMIAVRIGPDWRLVAVASPTYLLANPAPVHPQDLLQHDCINRRLETAGGLYAWEFEKDGKELRVRVEGQLALNDDATMINASLHGHGIAYVPEDMVTAHLASGDLILLLDDWSPRFSGYHIYYPSRRQNLPAFKVIVDTLRYREA